MAKSKEPESIPAPPPVGGSYTLEELEKLAADTAANGGQAPHLAEADPGADLSLAGRNPAAVDGAGAAAVPEGDAAPADAKTADAAPAEAKQEG